jgi:hypothetical protein
MQYFKLWADPGIRFWFRNSDSLITSDLAYLRCDSTFNSIVDSLPADSMYYLHPSVSIDTTISGLVDYIKLNDYLWFYEVYDEANSQQRQHSVGGSAAYDDFIPNIFTQDTLDNGALSLEEIEPSGIFSIQKYYAEHDTTKALPFTMNFALLHTIEQNEYTGLTEAKDFGTFEDQARCVEAMMEAQYQFPPPDHDSLVDNAPDFIMFDYYPFRYVNPDSAPSAPEMCDEDWLFLVEHFEEGIDSTVMPAHEYDCPVFYYPQTFGRAGGPHMWNNSYTALEYLSYYHRKPAPQEFRMLCNLALLHQAKGIFPYNVCSYVEYDEDGEPCIIMSSLLDIHNIPFDAAYEDWRYTGRWPGDSMEYIRPDSIPPWIDGYDPLYDLPDYPSMSIGDPKNAEKHYEWLFQPYAELYNNLYDILAEVKRIGPEMHNLWWWEENGTPYWDIATITVPDSALLDNYVSPRIKVFYSDSSDHAYLFYVNRFCGEYYMGSTDEIPMYISIYGTDLPGSPGNPYLYEQALDHNRRCIIPVTSGPRDLYTIHDTLSAGQGRLIEFIDTAEGTDADIRITSPDVFTYPSGTLERRRTHEYTAGATINLGGTFYNMGTDSTDEVEVTFMDRSVAIPIVMDRDTISFDGLSQDYVPDSASAMITWTTDSTDIGPHIIEIEADSLPGEPGHDNSIRFTVLIQPRDYATAVLHDPWDMDDDTTSSWFTSDIEAVSLNWDTTSTGWTDSVSGMFEGVIEYDDTLTPPFQAEISLAIPSDTSDYIDTDRYHLLSFGIVANNENITTGSALHMKIRWKDDRDQWHGWYSLLGSSFSVGNGWDQYATIGPIDLDSISNSAWDDNVCELWIRMTSIALFEPPDSINVRIGWIRLEEGP